MKVQLVLPPEEGYIQRNCWLAPLGLLSLATNLKQEIPEVEIEILDGNISNVNSGNNPSSTLDGLEKRLDGDLIGFSPSITSYRPALKLAEGVKKRNPETTVVFGGPHVTALARNVLTNREFVDMVVAYDGEKPLEYIVKRKLEGRSMRGIPNLFYRDSNGIIKVGLMNIHTQLLGPGMRFYKLSELPLPDFSLIDMQPYFEGVIRASPNVRRTRLFSTYAQHGCLFRSQMKENACIHCCRSDPIYRVLNPRRYAKYIRELQDNFGAQIIHDVSDDFTGSKHWVREFRDAYKAENLDVRFAHFARADEIDEEMTGYLGDIKSGLVFIGFETGDDELLKINQKLYTKDHMINATKRLNGIGATVQGSFIFGYPGETIQTIENTIRFADELARYGMSSISFSIMTPLPPSPGWDMFMGDPEIRAKYQHRDDFTAEEVQRDFVARFCGADYDTMLKNAQRLLSITPYRNFDYEPAQCPLLQTKNVS